MEQGWSQSLERLAEEELMADEHPARAAEQVGRVLRKHLDKLKALTPDQLVQDRYEKFRAIGAFTGE